MATYTDYSSGLESLMKTDDICAFCKKRRIVGTVPGKYDDQLFCSCGSYVRKAQDGSRSDRKLSRTQHKSIVGRSSAAECNSSPCSCGNCEVTTLDKNQAAALTLNDGKQVVICSNCLREMPEAGLDGHRKPCLSCVIKGCIESVHAKTGMLESRSKQTEYELPALLSVITEQRAEIEELKVQDAWNKGQIGGLSKTCQELSKQNSALQARLVRLEQKQIRFGIIDFRNNFYVWERRLYRCFKRNK